MREDKVIYVIYNWPIYKKENKRRKQSRKSKTDLETNMPGGESVKWTFCRSSVERRAKTSFLFCIDSDFYYHA